MPLLILMLLLSAANVVPKDAILVKGAVPSASDATTPVPEEGRIAGGHICAYEVRRRDDRREGRSGAEGRRDGEA